MFTFVVLLCLIPVRLCFPRIINETSIVMSIFRFFKIQRMLMISAVFRASHARRIFRLADGTSFGGALLEICHY